MCIDLQEEQNCLKKKTQKPDLLDTKGAVECLKCQESRLAIAKIYRVVGRAMPTIPSSTLLRMC